MKQKRVIAIATLIALIAMLFQGMNETKINAATFFDADVTTASTGCTMLGVRGDYLTDTVAALEYINQIRYEACENGYKDPRNEKRNLTLSDYKPIQWDQSLERIARLRAVESSMTMNHVRLNGKSWSFQYGGVSSSAECLAWNYKYDVKAGITQWYTEKKYWTTSESGVTGHYTAMINPNNTYVGLGDFYCETTHYSNTLAGEFGSTSGNLGSTPLQAQSDIIQKVEVKDDYYSSMIQLDDTIGEGTTQNIVPKAIVSYPGGYDGEVDFLYNSYSYSSLNTTVATVSSTGVITAKAKGTTTITISSGGKIVATKDIEVGCPHDYVYTKSGYTYSKKCSLCGDVGDYDSFNYCVYGGSSLTGSFGSFRLQSWSAGDEYYVWPAYTKPADNSQIKKTVYVESSDPEVMTVIKTGYDNMTQMKFLKPGIVELKITPKEDPKLSSSYTIRVQGDTSLDITDTKVEMPDETYTYDKEEKKPIPTVYYKGILLQNGTDYSISYENNTDAGIASLIITGKGIFSGKKTVDFVIEKPSIKDAKVTLSQTTYSYSGSGVMPKVKVVLGSTSLTEGIDYSLSYENNVSVGTGRIIVKGINCYSGELTQSFSIIPLEVSKAPITVSCEESTYSGTAQAPKVTVKVGTDTLVNGVDYSIESIAKTNAGKYDVEVSFIKNYTGTLTATWTIGKAKSSVSKLATAVSNLIYTGKAQELILPAESAQGTIVYALTKDGEYTSTIPTATKAGEYQIYYKVLGNENYTDSDVNQLTAKIAKAPSRVVKVPVAKELVYNGTGLELVEAGQAEGGKIVYSLDQKTYQAQIPTAVSAGTHQVYYKVVGDENHLDSVEAFFTVVISKATPIYTIPENLSGRCTESLVDVELPEGFEWKTEDAILSSMMDDTMSKVTAIASYTPKDLSNYEKVDGISIIISIRHDLICQPDGKGNHSEKCRDCIYENESVPCHGGKATCCSKAICEVCNTEYGECDPTNHVNTKIVNQKSATCKESGYTGDTICCDCGELLEEGQEIPKLTTHTYENGICVVCGKKEEILSVIPPSTIVDETNTQRQSDSEESGDKVKTATGTKVTSSSGNYVISDSDKKEVTYTTPTNEKAKTITIPDSIIYNGERYKVTDFNTNAIRKKQRVTKIVIGKNVKSIRKNAFKGFTKLKTIIVKSTLLKSKGLNKKAFSGVKKTMKIIVPKSKLSVYKKLFRKKGLSKKVKVQVK